MYNIEWDVQNGESLQELESAVIVSNHQSVLDSMGK
jgi:1-acyl-sn-glycerol-3-phosphate acyltransferase